jgi:hypothetical protein
MKKLPLIAAGLLGISVLGTLAFFALMILNSSQDKGNEWFSYEAAILFITVLALAGTIVGFVGFRAPRGRAVAFIGCFVLVIYYFLYFFSSSSESETSSSSAETYRRRAPGHVVESSNKPVNRSLAKRKGHSRFHSRFSLMRITLRAGDAPRRNRGHWPSDIFPLSDNGCRP